MIPLRAGALATLLLGVAGLHMPVRCQVPTTVQAIPVFPGAARQADQEEEQLGPGLEGRVYRVKAPIEAVLRFYQERLAAREIGSEEERDSVRESYERLAVGRASGATVLPEFVDLTPAHFAETAEEGEDATKLAAAWHAAYVAKRPPLRPDTWVESATFEWGARPAADQRVEFTLSLEDVGASQIRDSAYEDETQIVISAQRAGAAAAQAANQVERAPGAPTAAPTAPTAPPTARIAAPTAAQVGVPIYPGARFDGRTSASLSAGDSRGVYYVYTSPDAPARVNAFYQRRTGRTGTRNGAGVLIVVRGQAPSPDLGVTVQPNPGSYPPAVKTVITVRKKK